jgi:hypothetical protein
MYKQDLIHRCCIEEPKKRSKLGQGYNVSKVYKVAGDSSHSFIHSFVRSLSLTSSHVKWVKWAKGGMGKPRPRF